MRYEYACRACHGAFEAEQRISDAPLTECPHCGSGDVSRLVGGGSGVIFRGAGFYETDYKAKSGVNHEQ